MVDEAKRAWHAGASCWAGETDINSCSVGIEIHNSGHFKDYPDFPDRQMAAVEELCLDIMSRHAIPPPRVLAHSDVAPGRKIDPGEKFDWARLYRAGIGHWVEPATEGDGTALRFNDQGDAVRRLQSGLAGYGYGIEVTGRYDRFTRTVVAAFQLHFRQSRIDGVADRSTCDTLGRLLSAVSAAS
jgi:N-acetylmuramoyl-L-alanine amidase